PASPTAGDRAATSSHAPGGAARGGCDNEVMIRAYAPLVGLTLARSWPPADPVAVFAPGPHERSLTGDDLELAEYRAMSAAAASLIDEALDAGSPRAVVAVDVPEAVFADAAPVVPGVVLAAAVLDPLRV